MTPEDFKQRMEEIEGHFGGDLEAAHCAADDLMCSLLRSLGYADGVLVFERMPKWYA